MLHNNASSAVTDEEDRTFASPVGSTILLQSLQETFRPFQDSIFCDGRLLLYTVFMCLVVISDRWVNLQAPLSLCEMVVQMDLCDWV